MRHALGLDPAGPGFTVPFDLGEGTRLDETCANYVQCIRTSAGTLGTAVRCGHADFILNGGFAQPGCGTIFCSHSRGHEYFIEAMHVENDISGNQCDGPIRQFIKTLISRQCSTIIDRIGIHTRRLTGVFYVETNSESPFAMNVAQSI